MRKIITVTFKTFVIILISTLSGDKKLPNIIFLITDSLGYRDVGCDEKNQIGTPNLNKMTSGDVKQPYPEVVKTWKKFFQSNILRPQYFHSHTFTVKMNPV